jgi:hypothetical protein
MNKIVSKLRIIISALIIMLLGYGLFSNIVNMTITSKKYKINYDNKTYTEIKKTIKTINTNNEKIQSLKTTKLNEEELNLVKNIINNITVELNKLGLENKKGTKELSSKELYKLENKVYALPLIYFSSLATIWDNNNLSYVNTKSLVDSNMSVLVNLRENMKYDLENNYRYFYNNNQNQVNILNSYLDYYTKLVEYNSNILLKVGDITNE